MGAALPDRKTAITLLEDESKRNGKDRSKMNVLAALTNFFMALRLLLEPNMKKVGMAMWLNQNQNGLRRKA